MRVSEWPMPALVAMLSTFAFACSEGGAENRSVVVRDSAGIAIVENPSTETAPTFAFTGPLVEIGEVSGEAEYELDNVSAVVPLSDGSVAVATGGTEIRWYDANGRFRRRAGGDGGGPGEFRGIRYMRGLHGDSLLVFDSRNRRVTWFAPDGSFARDEPLRQNGEMPSTVSAALEDGTLLTRSTVETPPASTPLYRAQHAFVVHQGDSTHQLRQYPGPETALEIAGSGGNITSVFIFGLPFGRAVHAAGGPNRFFVGSSDSYDIDVWSAAGQLVRIIRVDMPVEPVTEELLQAFIEDEIRRRRALHEQRGQPFNEAEVRQQLRGQRHAPAVPAFSSLLATDDGGLWVSDFRMPGAESTMPRWTMFDGEGRMVGTIELQGQFTPMYVEQDVVWGVSRDALDVQYIHSYRILAPAD